MAKKSSSVLTDLTTAELKRLLAARQRIDVLENEKTKLLKQLALIERELAKLVRGAKPAAGRPARRKTAKKKTSRRKTTKRKVVAKKTSARKTTRKKAAARKAVKKPVRKPRMTLEDVIVKVLGRRKMAFKDLHAKIVEGKLFNSKSAKFDNVLRRTLSTSKKIKRVGRGIYKAA